MTKLMKIMRYEAVALLINGQQMHQVFIVQINNNSLSNGNPCFFPKVGKSRTLIKVLEPIFLTNMTMS